MQGRDGERGWGGQAGVGEVIERAVVAGRARHHRAVLAVLQKDRAALLVRSTPRERTVCGPNRKSRDPRQTKAGERTREVLGEDECVAREARRNLPPRHRPQRPKPAGGPTAKNHNRRRAPTSRSSQCAGHSGPRSSAVEKSRCQPLCEGSTKSRWCEPGMHENPAGTHAHNSHARATAIFTSREIQATEAGQAGSEMGKEGGQVVCGPPSPGRTSMSS